MCGRFSYSFGTIKDSEESGSKSCPPHEKRSKRAIAVGNHLCSFVLSELELLKVMEYASN